MFSNLNKLIAAADDPDVAEAIAQLRSQLKGGEETFVNDQGTIYNPADPASTSSVGEGKGFKAVDKAVVAAPQWYELDPALKEAEIKAMRDIAPYGSKLTYTKSGNMAWVIRLRPVVCGKQKDWTLYAVYDSDHPQQRWGGSVKFYPVKPNYDEMLKLVKQSKVVPKSIPHLLKDSNNRIYICTQHYNNIHAGSRIGEQITTAAACLRFAMRWITVFELGLIDQETWSLFQEHGKI
jgi:hypothetical protein